MDDLINRNNAKWNVCSYIRYALISDLYQYVIIQAIMEQEFADLPDVQERFHNLVSDVAERWGRMDE